MFWIFSVETSAPPEAEALQKWSPERQKCLLFFFAVGIFSNDIFAWKRSMHSYLCISPTFSILALSKHPILDVLTDCVSSTSRFTSLPIIYLCICIQTCRLMHRDRLKLIWGKTLIPSYHLFISKMTIENYIQMSKMGIPKLHHEY